MHPFRIIFYLYVFAIFNIDCSILIHMKSLPKSFCTKVKLAQITSTMIQCGQLSNDTCSEERERNGLVKSEQVPHSQLYTRATHLCLCSIIRRVRRYPTTSESSVPTPKPHKPLHHKLLTTTLKWVELSWPEERDLKEQWERGRTRSAEALSLRSLGLFCR